MLGQSPDFLGVLDQIPDFGEEEPMSAGTEVVARRSAAPHPFDVFIRVLAAQQLIEECLDGLSLLGP